MTLVKVRTEHQVFYPIADWAGIASAIDREEIQVDYIAVEVELVGREGVKVTFMDQMEPLVQELCLHAVQKLLVGEDFSFQYWNYAGEVRLQLVGEEVAVAGDFIVAAKFPKRELIAGLLGAAAEVMDLMERIHLDYPAYRRPGLEHFQEVMAECRRKFAEAFGRDAVEFDSL